MDTTISVRIVDILWLRYKRRKLSQIGITRIFPFSKVYCKRFFNLFSITDQTILYTYTISAKHACKRIRENLYLHGDLKENDEHPLSYIYNSILFRLLRSCESCIVILLYSLPCILLLLHYYGILCNATQLSIFTSTFLYLSSSLHMELL